MNKYIKHLFLSLLMVYIGGCAINPVTGDRNISFVDSDWEKNIGKQAYGPSLQSQGGEYEADPQVIEYVRAVGNRLAAVSDRKDLDYEFTVINDSVPNAWALPGGKIAINRGLLTELNSEAELAAVLGHEIIHAAARHGAQAQSRGVLSQIGVVATGIITGSQALSQGASMGAQLFNQSYSRGAESESDKYGMLYMSRAGYDPKAAIKLQETFVRLSEGRDSSFASGLFASHPPSKKRVVDNIANAKELPQGGEIGEERYKKALARLFKTKDAYAAYDQAQKVLAKDKDTNKARELLAFAKKEEPLEGKFDLLLGDIYYFQGDLEQANQNFIKAAEKNPSYFEPFFSLGLTHYKMGNLDKAKPNLMKVNELIPRADVFYYLGDIDKRQNNIKSAIGNFNKASSSDSEFGEKSKQELQQLSRQYPQYFR